MHEWYSHSERLTGTPATFDQAHVIQSEPILYHASVDFARDNGGPIINRVLDKLAVYSSLTNAIVDTRSAYLAMGWYAGDPHWRISWMPRDSAERYDMDTLPEITDDIHYICAIGNTVPAFRKGRVIIENGNHYADEFSQQVVNRLANAANPATRVTQYAAGSIIQTNGGTVKRDTCATTPGWSWRCGVALMRRRVSPANIVSKQVQVFVTRQLAA